MISGNKALECTNSNFTCAKAMSEPDDSEDNYSGDEVGEKELFGEESEGDGEGEGEGEGEASDAPAPAAFGDGGDTEASSSGAEAAALRRGAR